jgi:secreted protein with Ig-like and vWFA domain
LRAQAELTAALADVARERVVGEQLRDAVGEREVIPPTGVLTNGRPAAIASERIIGSASASVGSATTRAPRRISRTSAVPTGARTCRRSAAGGV